MNAIIIEDEKLSAEYLANLLKRVDKNINVIHTFDSVKSAVVAFENGVKADVLFLDIHLADGLSFDIFSKVNIETPVIFTTAYDEYAIKAFKFNSIDYLLKPIGLSDLTIAVEKLKKLNQEPSVIFKNISQVYENMQKQHKNRFMVKMGDNLVSVKVEDAAYFIAEDGIVLLATKNEKRYPIDYPLDQLEPFLDPTSFFRMNRKVIVNINAIQKINTYFNSRLKIVSYSLNEDDAIVSRDRVQDFKAWLDK